METEPSLANTLRSAVERYPWPSDFGFFVASGRVAGWSPPWYWRFFCDWQGTFYWFETELEAFTTAKAVLLEWWSAYAEDDSDDEDDVEDWPLDEYSPDFNPVAWRGSLRDLRLSRDDFTEDIRCDFWCNSHTPLWPFVLDMEGRGAEVVIRGIADSEMIDFVAYLRRHYPAKD